ncbi:hypothetical protein SAMN02910317_01990 [Ruminococcaceae bacterium FB2012]|nr:hypothetical protein SAMN02910317_01990 [Ruminococcaceae bacterium FB2012]
MNNNLYGQADYYYAVSRQLLAVLVSKGLITEKQRAEIDALNKKTIFENYSSIAELEVSA